jgi:hypothetical protein
LRTVLLGRPHTVIVGVPYRREDVRRFKAPSAAEGGDGDDDGDATTGPHAAGTAVPVAEPGQPEGRGAAGDGG